MEVILYGISPHIAEFYVNHCNFFIILYDSVHVYLEILSQLTIFMGLFLSWLF